MLLRIQERQTKRKSSELAEMRGLLPRLRERSFQEVLTIEQPIAA